MMVQHMTGATLVGPRTDSVAAKHASADAEVAAAKKSLTCVALPSASD